MLHTMELFKSIPKQDFDLISHSKAVYFKDADMKVSRFANKIHLTYDKNSLKNVEVRRGINKVTFTSSKNGFCFVYIKINIPHLIGHSEPRKPIRINTDDFENICVKLQESIKIFCNDIQKATKVNLNLGSDFKVSRIDYAVDIKTKDVDEYIRLLKKGTVPAKLYDRGYKDNLYYTNNSKRTSMRRTINCYNKTKSSRNKGIRAEKDILRFEVQLGIKQIEKMLEKYNLEYYVEYKKANNIYYLLEVSSYVLKFYYKSLVPNSNFYTKSAIEKKIHSLPDNQQDIIKSYLIEIVKKGSTLKSLKKLHKEAIELLKSLDINPIPLKATYKSASLNSLYNNFIITGGEENKKFN